jgi:hypothetical protein
MVLVLSDTAPSLFGNAVQHLAAKSKLLCSESRHDFRLDRLKDRNF